MTTAPSRFWLSSATGLAVVGLCTGGVLLSRPAEAGPGSPTIRSSAESAAVPPSAAVSSPDGSATVARTVGSTYRNGEYSATGSYITPGGDESIGVTIVVAEGLVTDAVVRTEALSPTARQFQVQFGSGIGSAVVGRELAGLSVSRVAGASLTSVGFNDAITRIQAGATS